MHLIVDPVSRILPKGRGDKHVRHDKNVRILHTLHTSVDPKTAFIGGTDD